MTTRAGSQPKLKQWFAPEPLLAFIAQRAKEHDTGKLPSTSGIMWVGRVFGPQSNMYRQMSRWKKGERLSWWYADKVAGLLGVHPAWIWDDWYDLQEQPQATDEEVAA